MKLLLRRFRKSHVRYRFLKSSLLPAWIYWPQLLIEFVVVFLWGTIVDVMKTHFLTLTLIGVGIVTGQRITGGDIVTHIIEGVSAVLLITVVALKSRASVIQSKENKHRVIHTGNVSDEQKGES